jgi:hypothetical protein
MSVSEIIVLTAGRPDILTDSRVYSLFEYTKMKKISYVRGDRKVTY